MIIEKDIHSSIRCFLFVNAFGQVKPSDLAHTFSIVARDARTGEMVVAVQSHWFSVGTVVSWGENGRWCCSHNLCKQIVWLTRAWTVEARRKISAGGTRSIAKRWCRQRISSIGHSRHQGSRGDSLEEPSGATGHLNGAGFLSSGQHDANDKGCSGLEKAWKNTKHCHSRNTWWGS